MTAAAAMTTTTTTAGSETPPRRRPPIDGPRPSSSSSSSSWSPAASTSSDRVGAAAAARDVPSPPWQVLWKRPRWDRVAAGRDDEDDDDDDDDDGDGDGDCDGQSSVVDDDDRGGGVFDSSEIDDIRGHWTPVSASSIALTRDEARAAVVGLRRPPPSPRRRDGGGGGPTTTTPRPSPSRRLRPGHRDGGGGGERNDGGGPSPPPPAGAVDAAEEVTPTRRTGSGRAAMPSSSSSAAGRRTPTRGTGNGGGSSSSSAAGGPPPPPSIPPKSASSSLSSRFFKSVASSGGGGGGVDIASAAGKPPRGTSSANTAAPSKSRPKDVSGSGGTGDRDDDDDESSPPSSPTSFSTFDLPSPANAGECVVDRSDDDDDDDDYNDDDDDDAARTITDASTASSLLWGEDMTLTSVSAEEALAIKWFGLHRPPVQPQQLRWQQERHLHRRPDNPAATGGGAATVGIHGKRERRPTTWDDWDGLDHVVLSATIFSTAAASAAGAPSRGGEVVVMELLHTSDPRRSNIRRQRPLQGQRTQRTGTMSACVDDRGRGVVVVADDGSTPSSSLSEAAGDDGKIELGRTTTRSHRLTTANSTANSTATATTRAEGMKSSTGDGGDRGVDDEDGGAANRTRILARRVLYWPSSILSSRGGAGDGEVDGGVGGGDRPSFVSLGRTSAWKGGEDDGAVAAAPDNGKDWSDDEGHDDDNDRSGGRVTMEEAWVGKGGNLSSSSDRNENEESAADALEAFQSLNFLFGGAPRGGDTGHKKAKAATNRSGESARNNQSSSYALSGIDSLTTRMEMKRTKKRLTQPLSMCLISNDGRVHFFYALRVLRAGKSNRIAARGGDSSNADLSNGLASMLFGSAMFARVEKTVMPLSCPRASMRLSQLRRSPRATVRHRDSSAELGSTVDDYSGNGIGGDWSNLGQLDASIDPSSLHLCTIPHSNVLTGSCVTSDTSNGYLAICGRGLRRPRQREAPANGGGRVSYALGGFVTFVSLRHCAESRTIYLPFAPESIQPVFWSGMHFVVLLGEGGRSPTSIRNIETPNDRRRRRKPCVMAVRVDCKQVGENDVLVSYRDDVAVLAKRHLYPDRFQCVPIELPSVQESLGLNISKLFSPGEGESDLGILDSKAIAISSIPSSPPGILLSFQSDSSLIVVNHTLLQFRFEPERDGLATGKSTGMLITLSTVVLPGHRAVLASEKISPRQKVVCCVGGQGWSLVGTQGSDRKSYFICWDGATDDSRGPYILPLQLGLLMDDTDSKCITSAVTPLLSHVKYAERMTEGSHRESATSSPASKPYILPSFFLQDDAEGGEFPPGFSHKMSLSIAVKESIEMAADIEGGIDEIIVNALDSISSPQQHSPRRLAKSTDERRSIRNKSSVLSHQEKSLRLLRRCPTWTQLDDTQSNHRIVHGQVVVATVRVGAHFQSLTLRTNIVANPISTPFDQILSWLCQRRDYYTAASIALRLLDEEELCRIPKTSEEELSHHKGLLDGIRSLSIDNSHGNKSETLTYLADMTVVCLIKGAASSVLEGFLLRNTLYSASHACIMLVGTAVSAVSREPAPNLQLNKFDNIVDMISNVEIPGDEVIWPVRCLIKMAVVRKCLPTAIMMLNATIPNELRWRAPKSRGLSPFPRPSLGLFLALVGIILESTEEATRYLLNMTDEDTGLHYWFSINDDTRLALSLLQIHGKHVFLLEPEVRAWALDRLKEEIECPTDFTFTYKGPLLSNRWLREVVSGAFCNADCEIAIQLPKSMPKPAHGEAVCYREDMVRVQDRLVPRNLSTGLDYDIVILALLILASRRCDCWREGEGEISTQTLLNTVCDMAGRKMDFEPRFVFDGAAVMRLCALADNMQAAAFLIGGKNGLIIECADLLVSSLEMSIREAETALFAGSLVELMAAVPPLYEGVALQLVSSNFMPSESHHHLLWLLQHHVIDVHTYGKFESDSYAGKITPVIAGKVCFRAWYCLTRPSDLSSSAKWLEKWLRKKLDLTSGKSTKRLACAAIVRALLWADEVDDLDSTENDEEILLATMIGFESRFMAELAHACCGLIQSIPPHLAEEIMSSLGSSNMISFDSSLINPHVKH